MHRRCCQWVAVGIFHSGLRMFDSFSFTNCREFLTITASPNSQYILNHSKVALSPHHPRYVTKDTEMKNGQEDESLTDFIDLSTGYGNFSDFRIIA